MMRKFSRGGPENKLAWWVVLQVKKVSANGKKVIGKLNKKTGLKKGAKFKLILKKLAKRRKSKKERKEK